MEVKEKVRIRELDEKQEEKPFQKLHLSEAEHCYVKRLYIIAGVTTFPHVGRVIFPECFHSFPYYRNT